MSGEVLDTKGNLSTGILCLYITTKGSMLFSESAKDNGDSWAFDASKTCIITVSIRPDGKTMYHIEKATTQFGGPTRLFIPKGSVAAIQDITDRDMLTKARSVLSGLVVVN